MFSDETEVDVTARYDGAERRRRRYERRGATDRRGAERHFLAVVASEIHRLSLELRPAPTLDQR
jgi:hypothetical protein